MPGSRLVCALLALAIAVPAAAQTAEKKRITIEETLLMENWGSYALSPDASTIAFTKSKRDPESFESTSHIWLYAIASGESYQLTNSENGESNPRWLPDGRILFTSDRGEDGNALWAISPRGGEAVRFIDRDDPPNGSRNWNEKRGLPHTFWISERCNRSIRRPSWRLPVQQVK
jgi:dipeptidyl aminopeptidase/acylaminoacyl peptidase